MSASNVINHKGLLLERLHAVDTQIATLTRALAHHSSTPSTSNSPTVIDLSRDIAKLQSQHDTVNAEIVHHYGQETITNFQDALAKQRAKNNHDSAERELHYLLRQLIFCDGLVENERRKIAAFQEGAVDSQTGAIDGGVGSSGHPEKTEDPPGAEPMPRRRSVEEMNTRLTKLLWKQKNLVSRITNRYNANIIEEHREKVKNDPERKVHARRMVFIDMMVGSLRKLDYWVRRLETEIETMKNDPKYVVGDPRNRDEFNQAVVAKLNKLHSANAKRQKWVNRAKAELGPEAFNSYRKTGKIEDLMW